MIPLTNCKEHTNFDNWNELHIISYEKHWNKIMNNRNNMRVSKQLIGA